MENNDSQFWIDLQEDLKDPVFYDAFVSEAARLRRRLRYARLREEQRSRPLQHPDQEGL